MHTNHEARIDAIQERLTNTLDPTLLDRVESILLSYDLSLAVDKMWFQRKFDNKRMSIYRYAFSNLIQLAPTSVESKLELLKCFTDNFPAIEKEAFTKSYRKTIDDIVPERIVKNETYQAIKHEMFFASTFRGKGIGPGEFALAVLGRDGNIVDANGDITVEGWGIELKDGKAGSLKPGNVENTHRVADEAKDEIARTLGLTFTDGKGDFDNKFMLHRDNKFVRAMKQLSEAEQLDIMHRWAEQLYIGLPANDRIELVENIVKDLGTAEARQHYGPVMLNAYKAKDEWDSILFINTDFTIVNVVEPGDSKALLNFIPSITRGGNTQALPDGYVNAKIVK